MPFENIGNEDGGCETQGVDPPVGAELEASRMYAHSGPP